MTTVEKKLQYFYENHKIPHLLFYGSTDCEKEQIVSAFIHKIYHENRQAIKYNVLFVNCSGKGIRFIRDEIKTFAKMHIQNFTTEQLQSTKEIEISTQYITDFKTIILLNADYLTEDAQSALRRSIELFSHTTRFFIIAENKNKLLKPILSRFCEIYIPSPEITTQKKTQQPNEWIVKNLPAVLFSNPLDIVLFSTQVVKQGLSSFDVIYSLPPNTERTLNTTFFFHKIKSEYRCEKMLIITILYHYYEKNEIL